MPDEGLGILIPTIAPVPNRGHQLANAAEDATPEPAFGEHFEPLLDQVRPGGAGGREVKMPAPAGRMVEPACDLRPHMRREIVENDVDVKVLGHLGVDGLEEGEDVLRGVVLASLVEHLAAGHVERGEEIDGAVALVVVGHGARAAALHGQAGLGSIQGLDLTFRAPRGAMGTERPEMVAIGLSRQADEAEGSLTLGTQERAGAALTTRGRAQTSGPPGPSKRDREVDERNQRFKAPSRSAGSNPEDMGRNATHARARATPKPFEDNGEEATGKDCGVPVAMSQGQSWPPILSIGPW